MGQDTDLTALTLSQARDGLRAKEFSSRELTQSFIDRVAASKNSTPIFSRHPKLRWKPPINRMRALVQTTPDRWKASPLE